jgi:hypothetical protein
MEIPVYGQERVREAALPAARISAPTSPETFGGGDVAAGPARALQGLAAGVVDIAGKERERAVDVMTQDGYSKLVSEKNRLLHDKDSGALGRRGKDAFATPDVYGKQFDDAADKIEKDMPDIEARRIFRSMRLRERGEFNGVLSQHIEQESRRLEDETYKGLVSTLTDDAVSNLNVRGKIDANLKTLKAATDKRAAEMGLSGDDEPTKATRAAMWKEVTNRMHVGVIQRLVAQDNYDLARRYFDAHKSGISGMDMDALEGQIKKADEFKQKDSYLAAGQLLDKTPDADPAKVIPGFDTLSSQQREALRRRYQYEQSPTAHHEFYSLSSAELAKMDRAEFETKYWSRFDEEHRRKAEGYWKSAIEAQRTGRDEVFKSIRSDRDTIVNELRKAKIVAVSGDLKGEDFEKAQRIEDYIDERFKVFAHENKRNPKDEEKQTIIRKAMLDKVFVDQVGFDPEKPRAILTEDEIKKAYVPMIRSRAASGCCSSTWRARRASSSRRSRAGPRTTARSSCSKPHREGLRGRRVRQAPIARHLIASSRGISDHRS